MRGSGWRLLHSAQWFDVYPARGGDRIVNVSISDAKANLSALLARVEAGESIGITRRGTVVALLVPPISTVQLQPSVPALLQPKPGAPANGARGMTLAEIMKASGQ
jgi:prevent-host-death family protein